MQVQMRGFTWCPVCHLVLPHMWLGKKGIISGRGCLLLQLEIRLWESKKKKKKVQGWPFLVWEMWPSCCLGLKLLSGIESVHFTIVCKTKALASAHLEECTTKHLLCCWRKLFYQTAGYVEENTPKIKQIITCWMHSVACKTDNTGMQNTERWYNLFDRGSKTFTRDLSPTNLCHHSHVCHLSLTFSFHFSLSSYLCYC